MTRPAETISAIVTALVGLVTIAQKAIGDGFQAGDAQTILGAVMVLAAAVAPLVTWYTARRQRDPSDSLASAPDGAVVSQ